MIEELQITYYKALIAYNQNAEQNHSTATKY
jgi:hypothetical protein